MENVIPFPPPLAPPKGRLDPRLLVVDVDHTEGEVVVMLEFRHPDQTLRMRLHWRAGAATMLEHLPAERVLPVAIVAYHSLVDRLTAFAFFLESHDGTSANDVRLVVDALFPTPSKGAIS